MGRTNLGNANLCTILNLSLRSLSRHPDPTTCLRIKPFLTPSSVLHHHYLGTGGPLSASVPTVHLEHGSQREPHKTWKRKGSCSLKVLERYYLFRIKQRAPEQPARPSICVAFMSLSSFLPEPSLLTSLTLYCSLAPLAMAGMFP